jgi:amino acid transporter
VWDAASLIVGIVIGTAIFRSPPNVFSNSPSGAAGLWLWALGGGLSFIGALCYAELATAYPRQGGDYVYLTEAFGRWAGFLFAWTRFTVVLTGNIGVMAYAFSDYATEVFRLDRGWSALISAAVVIALTLVNLAGVAIGKRVQNVLSLAKIAALLAIMVAGFSLIGVEHATGVASASGSSAHPVGVAAIGLALVFVLYAYGGWSDSVFVAAEVREQQRNMPRALLLGMLAIMLLYVGVNAAYLSALGLEGVRGTETPATDVLRAAWGPAGEKAIGLIVMLSALGAINGMLFVGSRVVGSLGEDYRLLAILGRWNDRRGAPAAALMALGAASVLLVLLVGTEAGHRACDVALRSLGLSAMNWDQHTGGFETLLASVSPTFWAFFILTSVALMVLRRTDAGRTRPFRVPLYPLPPLLFCATSAYMLYSSVVYARGLSLLGFGPVALGLVVYACSPRRIRDFR